MTLGFVRACRGWQRIAEKAGTGSGCTWCRRRAQRRLPADAGARPRPTLPQGKLWIVMEFAGGGTLHDLIHRGEGPLEEGAVWRLAIQVGGWALGQVGGDEGAKASMTGLKPPPSSCAAPPCTPRAPLCR